MTQEQDKIKSLERKIQENYLLIEKLVESEKRFRVESEKNRILLKNASDGIHIVDESGNLVMASDYFCNMLGYGSFEEMKGFNVSRWEVDYSPKEIEFVTNNIIETGKSATFETRHRTKQGEVIDVEVSLGLVSIEGRRFVFASSRDIRNRKQIEKKLNENAINLERLAFTDELTGLPNRRALESEMEKAIARAKSRNGILTIIMIDLDEFKPVNDMYGNVAGDIFLQEVAVRLKNRLKQTDYIARMGGDEFIILAEDCAEMKEVVGVVEKIGAAVREPFILTEEEEGNNNKHEIRIDLSAGICFYPLHDTGNPDALLRYADQALYESKKHKDDRLNFWTVYGEPVAKRQNQVQKLLHQDGLQVWYQPVLENVSGKIVSIEALARFKDDDGTILTPDKFLPYLNRDDLFELFRQVMGKSLYDLEQFHKKFPRAGLRLSVNVDPGSVSEELIAHLKEVLGKSSVNPKDLVLEILESSDFSHGEEAEGYLHALKKLGVRLALDDIGSAYSSLLRLKELPIDEIKLDQGFIRGLSKDPSGILFTETVHDLAADLNVEMIVEGVENDSILEAMIVLGIPLLQGYAIARPMPAKALEEFLRASEHGFGRNLEKPKAWLSIYARHVSYDRLIRKTIKHDPSMISAEKLMNCSECPLSKDIQAMEIDPENIIVLLHKSYHKALSAVHTDLMKDAGMRVSWSQVELAHGKLLEAIKGELN